MATEKTASSAAGITALPNFLREAWYELKKVHSPSRQETIQATLVVLGMVAALAFFLGGVDFLLGLVMNWATAR